VSRFLFVSLPLTGHVHPIAAVAAALTGAGHEVAWVGSESFLRPLLGDGVHIYPVGLRLHRGQGDLGMTATRSRWSGYVVPHARHTFGAIDSAVRDFRPDVLAVDQHAVAGALVAHGHGLPWATVAPTSMELTRPYRALPKVEGWIQEQLAELWTWAGRPGDPPHDLRFSPHLVVAFTGAALTGNPPVANLALVGAALAPRPATVDFPYDWLDPHRRHVLLTVGTLAMDHAEDFYARAVEALRPLADEVQAIVVAATGTTLEPPPHILVTSRVPLLDLLPHLDAVVSHGGLNTVCETLAHGVPLVVAPIKDDQPVNASQVAAAGAGVRVSFVRSRPAQLRAAILAVLDDPAYRAAAARIRDEFRAAGGAAAAARHLAALADEAGPASPVHVPQQRTAVDMRTPERVIVAFKGEASGVDVLSWGQQEIWSAMQRQKSTLPIGGCAPLPEGRTVEYMAEELRHNLTRHHSMRTRLRFEPDGTVRQVVASEGEAVLEVYDAGDDDPADVAEQVRQRWWTTDFDLAEELPVRMAVVRQGDVLTHVVAVFCHLVADGFGALAMLQDLADRDPVTLHPKGPVTALQPLEQAQWQRSPAGVKQNEASMRYWEPLLRSIGPRRYAGSTDPQVPRHWEARFDSPAMHLAMPALVARCRVDTSTILLAAFSVSLARLTGIDPVVVQVVVSNRFRPGLSDTVSPINQTSLCVIEVTDITFDEAVTRARRSAMGAYKFAYYDSLQMDELIARIIAERGDDLDVACFVNDRRLFGRGEAPGEPATWEQVREALPRTTFNWTRRREDPFERLFLHLEDADQAVGLTICGDTHFVSPADMEACVRGMEAIIVEASFDGEAPTRVHAAQTQT